MGMIPWKDAYSVGIKEIDGQHKSLLEIINGLSEVERRAVDNKAFFATLNGLIKYAQEHFRTEERYMEEYGYPDLGPHQEAHAAFTEDVFSLQELLSKGDAAILQKILDFLKDWYISHILGTDREYIDFFAEKGLT